MSTDTNIQLPEWLLESSPPADLRHGPHDGFIKKTLSGIFEVYENEFYCEKYVARGGFLQSIDARVKLLTLLFFIVLGSFSHSILVLLLIGCTALLYATLSHVPIGAFLRRAWLYIPPLVFVLSLPAATNLFIHGQALLFLTPSHSLYFTLQGLRTACILALRAGVSLSMGYLLIITTRFSRLMEALHALHLPRVFVSVLSMAYRYIFLLGEAALNMMHARHLRTMGRIPARENRSFFGRSTAFLFVRVSAFSDDIYDAMCCRGYTGKPVSPEKLKLGSVDILFIINNTIVMLILLFWGVLF